MRQREPSNLVPTSRKCEPKAKLIARTFCNLLSLPGAHSHKPRRSAWRACPPNKVFRNFFKRLILTLEQHSSLLVIPMVTTSKILNASFLYLFLSSYCCLPHSFQTIARYNCHHFSCCILFLIYRKVSLLFHIMFKHLLIKGMARDHHNKLNVQKTLHFKANDTKKTQSWAQKWPKNMLKYSFTCKQCIPLRKWRIFDEGKLISDELTPIWGKIEAKMAQIVHKEQWWNLLCW